MTEQEVWVLIRNRKGQLGHFEKSDALFRKYLPFDFRIEEDPLSPTKGCWEPAGRTLLQFTEFVDLGNGEAATVILRNSGEQYFRAEKNSKKFVCKVE